MSDAFCKSLDRDLGDQLSQGWMVGEYNQTGKSILNNLTELIIDFTRKYFQCDFDSLTQYHGLIQDTETHEDYHLELTKLVHKSKYPYQLVESMLSVLIDLLGPDLDIQTFPHLRIARPNTPSDNLGLHRDTDLGASPYEISIWTPLCQLPDSGGGMKILPYSNSRPSNHWDLEIESEPIIKR